MAGCQTSHGTSMVKMAVEATTQALDLDSDPGLSVRGQVLVSIQSEI